jgi:protein MpaA
MLILAAIHGDESETTVVVSEVMWCQPAEDQQVAVILCCNPDGLLRGTRGNARGIDLNRNFPTSKWKPDAAFYKSRANDARNIALSSGAESSSEPETKALLALINELRSRAVVSLYSALASR